MTLETATPDIDVDQAEELEPVKDPMPCHLLDDAGLPFCGEQFPFGVHYARDVAATDPCAECGHPRCQVCAHPEGQA